MSSPVFILALEYEIDRFAFENLILSRYVNAKIIVASSVHELHKELFNFDDAVVIVNPHYFDTETKNQSLALTLCFLKSKWLVFCNESYDDLMISELLYNNKSLNIILHSDSLAVIAKAITATYLSQKFITEFIQNNLEEHKKRRTDGANKRNLLTTTEKEIIQLIILGKTAKEIAELRCLSYHTVNTHRKNIFRKLEINSVQELIKYAIKVGYFDTTEYYI